jgi:diguanylate cyclase (GGDEF)-like protein/PAS domain S-box-containing protein
MGTAAPKATSFSGETFTRRVVVPMAGMVILAILLVLGFAIISANWQNRLEVDSSTALAETALAVKKREIARNLQDYAVWEDVFKNLHQTLDFEWASTNGNVGANLYEGLGYDMAFVLRPDGKTVYSVLKGIPQQTADAFSVIPEGLQTLAKAGSNGEPEVGFLRSNQDVLLVAATAILPPSIDASTIPPQERSSLIFAKALDKTFVEGISSDYLLDGLKVVGSEGQAEGAMLPLLDPSGKVLSYITWTPATPGYQLLKWQLPPLAAAMVLLGLFAYQVIRKVRRSTEELEESARTVETYAQTIEESEARFRDVAEASSDWIWECDGEMRLVYLSARFSEVTGIAAASVLGKQLERFFMKDSDTEGWARLHESARDHLAFRDVRCSYSDAASHVRVCRLAGRPIVNGKREFSGFRGTATDITEEVEAHARANHLALHDALTELPNRLLFRERLIYALSDNRRDHGDLAVLCLDLDHFKEINDTLGHGAGDILLRQLAARLQACVRSGDTVARLGGDEFAIIQSSANQPADADALGRAIIEIVKQPFNVEGHELHIGVSIGVAFPDHANDPDKLLKNADIALYRAKQAGRGTVRHFEPHMDAELQARKALEYDLRQALPKNELELHYQPLIDLELQKVTAVEALLRWRHPSRGLVSPGEFISLAEETGLILSIGEWVLRTACQQALSWPEIRVAVNLSPVQFRHRELVDTVRQVLQDTGLEPNRLELEITESVLINDTEAALEILSALKSIGVQIAMDDFGTGYSSLGYLNSFPFDKIKIDKSFVSTLEDKAKSLAIVRSVIGLSESLSMATTAEGVETLEQASLLLGEGCKQGQGFYFGHPVPALEMTAFLGNWEGFSLPAAARTNAA